jgi:hypothetical protein
MGAPCNIDMNTYADDEYIIGVDLANVEIAEAETMIDEEVAVKFDLKEDK